MSMLLEAIEGWIEYKRHQCSGLLFLPIQGVVTSRRCIDAFFIAR